MQEELGLDIIDKRAGTNPNDIVFTPSLVAKMIVEEFKPQGKCLDPCRGLGAFYNLLPEPKDWCEITDGKDFFEYKERVDWIVSNPPYSRFDEWLDHSFELADNVLYLIPAAKFDKSWGTLKKVRTYGWVVKILYMPASMAGFPFGFPCGAYHFQRGYRGKTDIAFYDERTIV